MLGTIISNDCDRYGTTEPMHEQAIQESASCKKGDSGSIKFEGHPNLDIAGSIPAFFTNNKIIKKYIK